MISRPFENGPTTDRYQTRRQKKILFDFSIFFFFTALEQPKNKLKPLFRVYSHRRFFTRYRLHRLSYLRNALVC